MHVCVLLLFTGAALHAYDATTKHHGICVGRPVNGLDAQHLAVALVCDLSCLPTEMGPSLLMFVTGNSW